MKKIIAFLTLVLFAMPFVKNFSQEESSNSGAVAQLYNNLAQVYTVQGKEMSKEEEERLLKNLSPEIKTKLEEVKKLDKNKYYQLLRESSPFSALVVPSLSGTYSYSNGHALSLYENSYKERNEKIKKEKELEIDVELYALKCKNADKANQQTLKKELQSSLSQLFDIRESQKQEEVKQLEKRLQDLKESLQARKQNKDEIVQRRIQELLGDSRYLRWE
ncbi:MAG: hypothetical protein NTX65_09330 [Ignavibacteriales bacterium]|nr:hypothetical protein [Ignavibacteriales bacterium]